MNKKIIKLGALIVFAAFWNQSATAQHGFGTNQPNKASAVEIKSETKGLLIPRVSLTSLTDLDPIKGVLATDTEINSLLIYNLTTDAAKNLATGYYYWTSNGTTGTWNRIATGGDAKTEPWYNQATNTEATLNTQNIYQIGSVAIGKNQTATGVTLDVTGAVRGGAGHTGVIGANSVAFGTENNVSGASSGGFGFSNKVDQDFSFSFGSLNQITNTDAWGSSAFGQENKISGSYAQVFGVKNDVQADAAAAFGEGNVSLGVNSSVFGYNNIAASPLELSMGKYNAINISSVPSNSYTGATFDLPGATDPLFQIGNGTSDANRSNALTVLTNGNVGVGINGTEATAKPTQRLDIGSGNVRVRDINTLTGVATDKVVVADTDGVLKTVAANVLAPAETVTIMTPVAPATGLTGRTIATYKNEATNDVNIQETVTKLALNTETVPVLDSNGDPLPGQLMDIHTLTYTDEGGTETDFNMNALVATGETLTSLSYNGAQHALVYTDEKKNVSSFSMVDLVGDSQTLTKLELDIDNKRLKYTDENESLHSLNLAPIIQEPWYNSATNLGATSNTDDVYTQGWVGIGYTEPSSAPNEKLRVNGSITTVNNYYADYVFEDYFEGFSDIKSEYKFKTLEEVENFIKINRHLPGITPINMLEKTDKGYSFNVSELSIQLLEKTEELYLHTIEQENQLKEQSKEIDNLKDRLNRLESLLNSK